MSVLDWADLTAEQAQTLATATALDVTAGAELLNPDLTVADDLTADLVPSGSDMQWSGTDGDVIHRDCTLVLSRALNYSTALVRPWLVVTDQVSGLSARCNLGVFCMTSPQEPLGETVTDSTGHETTTVTVSGQDRLYLLDRQVGRSYVAFAGTNVLAAWQQVITDAGLSGWLVDTTRSDVVVPEPGLAWPLIPKADDTQQPVTLPDGTQVDTSSPATWLTVANHLLALIAYDGTWCDENGLYRASPYVDPQGAAASVTFDADAASTPVSVDRSRTADIYDAPNKWLFINSTVADTTLPSEGAGLYTAQNEDDGPSSIAARGGHPAGVWPTQVSLTAADQATLVTLGDKQVAKDKRGTTTIAFSTTCWPDVGHRKILTYTDARLGDPSTVKLLVTGATVHLDGSDTEWTTEVIG